MSVAPGQMLAHYRVIEKIGEGGMGAVWAAEDTKLDRRVALKILPPEFADNAERRERFEREAKAVAALNHPNIVTVHSVEQEGGVHFITMELVEGRPLRRCIPSSGFGLERFFELALSMADAIGAAHDRGITHRDLKPDNIMVGDDGRLRILDFGLAKLQEGAARGAVAGSQLPTATGEGRILGTVAYMSPEQAQGKPIDHRTDIFTAGVILYEMATGRRPFGGDNSVSIISSIVKDDPVTVTDLNPSMPRHLGRILRRSLEKDPERRYQRARDLHHELDDLRKEIQIEKIRASSSTDVTASTPTTRTRVWIPVVGILALVAAVALALAQTFRVRQAKPVAGSEVVSASVAVLPFVNMSPDAENEYFADGMTDELINALVRIGSLNVPARTSVFTFKGKDLTASEIGRQLNVEHVLEGSVRRSGDRLRITAQLIKVADDFHLWSEVYERQLTDVFAIQEEIAGAIVGNLEVRLVGDDSRKLVAKGTEVLDAYDLYLQGRFEWNLRSEKSLRKSIELFEQAIALDSGYALAWVGVSDAYFALSSWYRPPREVMPQAKEAALEALELDDSLVEAHTALANVTFNHDWDWSATEGQIERALELNPNSAEARGAMALLLVSLGDFEAGLKEARRALELDPTSHSTGYTVEMAYYFAREYETCVDVGNRLLAVDPGFHLIHSMMSLCDERLGRHREAVAAGREAVRLDESPMHKAILIQVLASAGERLSAETMLDELVETTEARYVCPYEIGLCHHVLGDTDTAIEWMERGYDARSDCWVWGNVDPRVDELREDERYRDLLRRVGHPVD